MNDYIEKVWMNHVPGMDPGRMGQQRSNKMTIKSTDEMERCIDLTGPEGNAFCLIGTARKLAKQLDKDDKAITEEMMSGDYENLVAVFEREFGEYVTLYR